MGKPRLLDLNNGGPVIVDEDALPVIEGYRWHVTSNGYVGAMTMIGGLRTMLLLHRLLTGAPKGMHVDHINGDTLDNRSVNLRVTTPSLNQVNRKRLNRNNKSGVRGVAWVPSFRRWRAQVMANRKAIHLGLFKTAEEAIAARKAAEIELFGEACP